MTAILTCSRSPLDLAPLVRARALTTCMNGIGLSPVDRRYLKSIAEAIHFAHEHGILHRDLKPSNVLVGSDERPRVTDFGLARRIGTDSSLTLSGQMLGSPNYMPPEQAAGGGGKVGRPADVYGLGAILYHLLTARPPFQAETIPQTIQLVTGAEPLSPRVLVPSVPRDLETICLKCLEKDPAKRYPTAQALAEELDRFFKGEPILARPVGPAGKVWRWCRRKPAVATAVGVALAAIVAVAVVSTLSAVRTNRARQAERLEAYYSAIALADQYIQQGDIQGAKDRLFSCPAEFRHWEWGHLMYLCHQDALSIETYTNEVPVDTTSQTSIANAPLGRRLTWLSFTPDGSALITQGADGSVKVWDTGNGGIRFAVGGPAQPVHWYTADSLGHRLATGGKNGTAEVFDLVSSRRVFTATHVSNTACCTALSPAGRWLVTGGGGLVRVWDVEQGSCLRQWALAPAALDRFELNDAATRLLVKQGRQTTTWDLSSGAELHRHETPTKEGAWITIEGDQGQLVTCDADMFDVRGVVMLRLLSMRGHPWRWHWEQHPVQVEGIRLGLAFRRLHVLHGMHPNEYDPAPIEDGATIGRYVLRYSDGTHAEWPVVVGRHVRDWWARVGEENPFAPLSEGTVVWTGSNPSAMDAKATLRLYLTSYENPHPEKAVVTVDYVSAMTTAAPFLVAMTVEP